jgi:hypothetical protein
MDLGRSRHGSRTLGFPLTAAAWFLAYARFIFTFNSVWQPGCRWPWDDAGEPDDEMGMKPQPGRSTQEVLAGLVERVTHHNDENGFCVLRAKARGHRDLVTVVGHAASYRGR